MYVLLTNFCVLQTGIQVGGVRLCVCLVNQFLCITDRDSVGWSKAMCMSC